MLPETSLSRNVTIIPGIYADMENSIVKHDAIYCYRLHGTCILSINMIRDTEKKRGIYLLIDLLRFLQFQEMLEYVRRRKEDTAEYGTQSSSHCATCL